MNVLLEFHYTDKPNMDRLAPRQDAIAGEKVAGPSLYSLLQLVSQGTAGSLRITTEPRGGGFLPAVLTAVDSLPFHPLSSQGSSRPH